MQISSTGRFGLRCLLSVAIASFALSATAASAKDVGSFATAKRTLATPMVAGERNVTASTLRNIMGVESASAAPRVRGGFCGDGLPGPAEQCDDGNTTSGDGCSADCLVETPFNCTIAGGSSDINDGGFELGGLLTIGAANPFWAETSDADLGGLFFTPICSEAACLGDPNAGLALEGEHFLWFGGGVQGPAGGVATATATQSTNVTAGSEVSFWTLRGVCHTNNTDSLTVSYNGSAILTVPCNATDDDWVLNTVTVPTAGPADLVFTGVTTAAADGSDFSNIFVDFTNIGVLTPTPSVCSNDCGNGAPNGVEQCDDGNTTNGDGCSSECAVEAGFECSAAVASAPEDAVGDFSFELGGLTDGAANPFWTEDASITFPPICSDLTCGPNIADTGTYYAWLGGTADTGDITSTPSVTQDVTLPASADTLTFRALRGLCVADTVNGVDDRVELSIDGNIVFTLDCDATENFYASYSIDLASAVGGPYNDGGTHTLVVAGFTTGNDPDGAGGANGNNWTNIFVDNVSALTGNTLPPVPSSCVMVEACFSEDFDPAIAGDLSQIGWTAFNTGALALDWGTTDDGACLPATGNSGNPEGANLTGGTGEALCIDTDAAGAGLVDAYACSPEIDYTGAVNPSANLLVNYQNFDGTPEDLFEILVGDVAPDAGTIAGFTSIFTDVVGLGGFTGGGVLLSGPQAPVGPEYWCFHYRANFDWWAQVDDFVIQAESCGADGDGDGVSDATDNCLVEANPTQQDSDGDGIGNLCDGDFNQDCATDFLDLAVFKARVFQSGDFPEDMDSSGIVDFVDLGIFKSKIFQAPGPGAPGNDCESR